MTCHGRGSCIPYAFLITADNRAFFRFEITDRKTWPAALLGEGPQPALKKISMVGTAKKSKKSKKDEVEEEDDEGAEDLEDVKDDPGSKRQGRFPPQSPSPSMWQAIVTVFASMYCRNLLFCLFPSLTLNVLTLQTRASTAGQTRGPQKGSTWRCLTRGRWDFVRFTSKFFHVPTMTG